MSDKKITRQLSIFINGKEIKNSLGAIGREISKVKAQLKEANDPSDIKKHKEELANLRKEYTKVDKEVNGNISTFSKLKKQLGPLSVAMAGAFSVGTVIAFFKSIADRVDVLRNLKGTISQITKLEGEALDSATSKVQSLSTTFDQDSKKMTEAAQNLSQQMKIGFVEALDLIEKGFLDGADANGEFLDKVREYPALLKEAGLSADEAINLMTQEVKQGIYSDKGVDAIKEANLRLREMTPAAQQALDAIGISSKTLQEELKNGTKTTFQAIQQVSERLDALPPQSKIVGQAIADIFGGPGEDAGLEYLSNLHKIDLTTNTLIGTTNEYARAKELELKANESLNNVWVKLTGTGSSLNVLYSAMKLGLADLLGTLTGTKDEALEAKEAFDDQARKVVNLNNVLSPLISEYEDLSSKTNLSESEQSRLKKVIEEIGNIVPTAITEFDEYGRTLDISAGKAKEFIETQKALLKYRNADLIAEETEKLNDLKHELDGINSALNKRNAEGDIVKTVATFTKTDNAIITEVKLSDAEIRKLQQRAQEIEQLQLGVQASLEEHTGDYLAKFQEAENKKTEKTAEQIAARETLEKTALDLRIKDIDSYSDEQLQVEITKVIERNQALAKQNEEARKAEAQRIERDQKSVSDFLLKEEAKRLIDKKSGIEKEYAEIDEKYRVQLEKARGNAELEKQVNDAIKEEKRLADEQYIIDSELRKKEILDQIALEKATSDEEKEILKAQQDIEKEELELERLKLNAEEKQRLLTLLQEQEEVAVANIRKKYANEKAKEDAKNNKKALEDRKKLNNQIIDSSIDLAGRESRVGQALLAFKGIMAAKETLISLGVLKTKAATAVAEGTMATTVGAANTAKVGFPQNIPLLIAFAGQAIGIISAIKGAVSASKSIKDTGFFYGGGTGNKALYYDSYGKVTGVVHDDEWVAPKIMTQDPVYASTFKWLEEERLKKLNGYFNGGPTSTKTPYFQTQNNTSPNLSIGTVLESLFVSINQLNQILENGIETGPVAIGDDKLQEIDKRIKEINNARENAKIA